jgi:hypothetical protein
MARTASGKDVLGKAKDCLSKAKTAEELRQAQTVILPLECGFYIEQTAAITGISVRWASHLRIDFIRSDGSCHPFLINAVTHSLEKNNHPATAVKWVPGEFLVDQMAEQQISFINLSRGLPSINRCLADTCQHALP